MLNEPDSKLCDPFNNWLLLFVLSFMFLMLLFLSFLLPPSFRFSLSYIIAVGVKIKADAYANW